MDYLVLLFPGIPTLVGCMAVIMDYREMKRNAKKR